MEGCLDTRLAGALMPIFLGIITCIKAEYDRLEKVRLSVNATSSRFLTLLVTIIATVHSRLLADLLVTYHVILRGLTFIHPESVLAIIDRREHSIMNKVPIYELPHDTISHILGFCGPVELMSFSRTSKWSYDLVHSQKRQSSNWLWRELSYNLHMKPYKRDFPRLTGLHLDWKEQFRTMHEFRFDTRAISPGSTVHFTNSHMTAENTSSSQFASTWVTLRSRIDCIPGKVYRFELLLNKFNRLPHNSYWIVVGIETSQFPFTNQDHLSDVIACHKEFGGAGLILGVGKLRYKGIQRDYCPTVKFQTGDVIGIVLDMRQSSKESNINIEQIIKDTGNYPGSTPLKEDIGGATLEFFLNGQSLGIAYQNLPGLKFFPTVSIVDEQIVTMKYWATDNEDTSSS
jgi:hypothetical protein